MLRDEIGAVAREAMSSALAAGYAERPPTPLVSDFWVTSLAPSSSEVMFRELMTLTATAAPTRICTVQPCVRIADLAPWSDGVHLPFFHMFTCFVIGCDDPLSDVRWFLDLLASLGAPVQDSYFTYFSGASAIVPDPQFLTFGASLLASLGVPPARRIPCGGTANYQLNLHRDETGNAYEVWGPRIEVIAEIGRGIEFGTLIFSQGRVPGSSDVIPPTLSMVFGIERLIQVQSGCNSVWELSQPRGLRDHASRELLYPASNFPLLPELEHLLEVATALKSISATAPELVPGKRGVRHQLDRLVDAAARKISLLGLEPGRVVGLLGVNAADDAAMRVTRWLEQAVYGANSDTPSLHSKV